jgi:hypothetical protein
MYHCFIPLEVLLVYATADFHRRVIVVLAGIHNVIVVFVVRSIWSREWGRVKRLVAIDHCVWSGLNLKAMLVVCSVM